MSKFMDKPNSIKLCGRYQAGNTAKIWLISIGALAGLIIQIILLNVPIVTIAEETKEPYYVTETNYQPYTLTENVVAEINVQKTITIADSYYTVVPFGVIVPFQIDRPDSHLTGTFENSIPGSFLIYDSANHIVWEKLGSRGIIALNLPPGSYRAKFQENLMWGEDVYIYLALEWNDVEYMTITQEISKYSEIPGIVKTERIALKEDKYSLWELGVSFWYQFTVCISRLG